MFDRFSNPARAVIGAAHQHSLSFGHDYIGTEHLLLGLLSVNDDTVDGVLAHQAILKPAVVRSVERLLVHGERRERGPLPFTPQAKSLLERSTEVAHSLSSSSVEPLHLLQAMLQDEDSVAAQVLLQAGWDTEAAKRWAATRHRRRAATLAPSPPPSPPMPMDFAVRAGFEKLTDRARRVLWHSLNIAEAKGRTAITPALLLAGLLHERSGVAVLALEEAGADLTRLGNLATEDSGQPSTSEGGALPLDAACEQVFDLAKEEARQLGHPYVGSEHLLLALAKVDSVSQLLEQVGIAVSSVTASVRSVLGVPLDGSGSSSALVSLIDQLERALRAGIAEGRWTREQARAQLNQVILRLNKP